jgi:hypothetical protein
MEVSGQLHATAALSPGKDCTLDGPHSLSGWGGEEKEYLPYPWRELNPGHPARSLVTILTELSRPLFSSYFVTYSKKKFQIKGKEFN